MQITMLDTRRGSEDGFGLKRYYKGETYDVADTLARDFIRKGYAQESLFEKITSIVREHDNLLLVKPDNK